jgi:hypothetical protein
MLGAMRRRLVVLAVSAFFLIAGAAWLAALIWKTSDVGGMALGPHLVGAALGGFALRRIVGDRRAIVLAAGGVLAWIGAQLLLIKPPWWPVETTATYLQLFALAPLCAAAAAAIRVAEERETRWRWLSVSALLTLGIMGVSVMGSTPMRDPGVLALLVLLGGPLFAGALTQYFAPRRWIWTCGGGSLVFGLIILDRVKGDVWRDPGGAFAVLCGIGVGVLLGAGGAALSWRLLRRSDPRTPTLPTAQIR